MKKRLTRLDKKANKYYVDNRDIQVKGVLASGNCITKLGMYEDIECDLLGFADYIKVAQECLEGTVFTQSQAKRAKEECERVAEATIDFVLKELKENSFDKAYEYLYSKLIVSEKVEE